MHDRTNHAVAVDHLVKIYKKTTAVDDISFALPAGSITALLGGNGAGKTTTIATIMGLVTPTSGRVSVLGAEMPRQRHRVLHRMNFESPYVDMPMRLTVRQNLTVFGQLYGVADIGARIATLAGQLDLTELIDRPTGKLSAGQKTQIADQRAGGAPARRADRLARPRHRRLGARAARPLSPRARCDRAPRLSQHVGG
jgi:ABC-2 type transport system ATP-binding protein